VNAKKRKDATAEQTMGKHTARRPCIHGEMALAMCSSLRPSNTQDRQLKYKRKTSTRQAMSAVSSCERGGGRDERWKDID
jgi:hypothetical protein